eukprot:NODE_6001_length_616_cov_32.409171_g5598_i0.p2 GENE.NODE_6001_length_616_cov_32.409171_g5598_i0~~NODE_6001_length_616_cov_32.409171_g5598_i0.p2  ORF type:complete len:179 (+),score=45.53 NODE_6001_length_616_cov_32.409171_g5598_i0:63-539(+)
MPHTNQERRRTVEQRMHDGLNTVPKRQRTGVTTTPRVAHDDKLSDRAPDTVGSDIVNDPFFVIPTRSKWGNFPPGRLEELLCTAEAYKAEVAKAEALRKAEDKKKPKKKLQRAKEAPVPTRLGGAIKLDESGRVETDWTTAVTKRIKFDSDSEGGDDG